MVEDLCRPAIRVRWFRLDRVRLPRRTITLRLALHQFSFRRAGHVRLAQRYFFLLPVVVGSKVGLASFPALELAWLRRPGDQRVVLQQSGAGRAVFEWRYSGSEKNRAQLARRMEGEVCARCARGAWLVIWSNSADRKTGNNRGTGHTRAQY